MEIRIWLDPNMINLVYIRAAIEANTGIRLKLPEVRRYLVEEGLITPKQAEDEAHIFSGYGDLYWTDIPTVNIEDEYDDLEGLPDHFLPGS